MEFINSTWPIFMGFITLVIVLAKMHGDIETIKEKVRVLFDLWNKKMTDKKSTVNKAGNYTKPTMRKNLFNKIKAGTKGGSAGQWSARKAQMLAKQYKAKGGGYK
jgi:hypothetical protein